MDKSTEDVIDWIEFYKKEYVRINGNDFIESINWSSNIDFIKDRFDDISIIWNRRWFNLQQQLNFFDGSKISHFNAIKLSNFLNHEKFSISTFIWNLLKDKKWLTNPAELRYTKPEILFFANQIGINIPETIITTSKEDLIRFKKKHNRVISKSVNDIVRLEDEEDYYITMTEEISDETINKLKSHFFPSLFQQLIIKEYEIRSFFLGDQFYSMAIFSQSDNKTEIDFRNYNFDNPNRTIPYALPDYLKAKLLELIKKLDYTTGSIDLLKSQDQKYYFLECNPTGQYGMTSLPCNYQLDQRIAKYLIDYENEKQDHFRRVCS